MRVEPSPVLALRRPRIEANGTAFTILGRQHLVTDGKELESAWVRVCLPPPSIAVNIAAHAGGTSTPSVAGPTLAPRK